VEPRIARARQVWRRDGGQCAFVGTQGRCTERGFLEFHHVKPHSVGGPAVVENIELRCRPHNAYEAEQYFGDRCTLLVREAGPLTSDVSNSVRTELGAPV
jgi:5-methylcytosine-specific restriction endonuclease McrA